MSAQAKGEDNGKAEKEDVEEHFVKPIFRACKKAEFSLSDNQRRRLMSMVVCPCGAILPGLNSGLDARFERKV